MVSSAVTYSSHAGPVCLCVRQSQVSCFWQRQETHFWDMISHHCGYSLNRVPATRLPCLLPAYLQITEHLSQSLKAALLAIVQVLFFFK